MANHELDHQINKLPSQIIFLSFNIVFIIIRLIRPSEFQWNITFCHDLEIVHLRPYKYKLYSVFTSLTRNFAAKGHLTILHVPDFPAGIYRTSNSGPNSKMLSLRTCRIKLQFFIFFFIITTLKAIITLSFNKIWATVGVFVQHFK